MKKKIFISLILICLGIGFLVAKEAKSGADDNVYGWAWSESIGLISFNSTNCDTDSNGFIDEACGGDNTTTPVVDYGVNIDPNTGLFSGYAWAGGGKNLDDSPAETIGWIRFDLPSDARYTNGYPAPPYYSACMDLPGDGQDCDGVGAYTVSGWARACVGTANPTTCESGSNPTAGGWDGWIKLRGTWENGIFLNKNTSEFEGWAWGGDDAEIFGWISFNCNNRGVCTEATGEGGPSDYKVMTNLAISEENDPPYIEAQVIKNHYYCSLAPEKGQISFIWTYQGPEEDDPMTEFVFQVDDNSDFSSPEVSRSYSNLNKPDGTINEQTVIISADVISDEINYNATQYYWRVRVVDSQENDSGWIYYYDNTDNDQFPVPPGSPGNPGQPGDGNPETFTTAVHAWPWPTFYWTPMIPADDEEVLFVNTTTFYNGASSYYWTFQDATPDSSPLEAPPLVTFTSMGPKKVTLRATDSDGYSCLKGSTVYVGGKLPSPDWIEVPPF